MTAWTEMDYQITALDLRLGVGSLGALRITPGKGRAAANAIYPQPFTMRG